MSHVRFVHFSLLTVCVLTLYFALVASASRHGRVYELEDLAGLVQQMRERPAAAYAQLHNEEYEEIERATATELGRVLGPSLGVPDLSPEHVLRVEDQPDLAEDPRLRDVREYALALRILDRIDADDGAVLADLKKIKVAGLVAEYRIESVAIETSKVTIEAAIVVQSSTHAGREGPLGAWEVQHSLTYAASTKSQKGSISEPDLARKFPKLAQELPTTIDKRISELEAQYRSDLVRGLEGETLEIFGTKFNAQYIAYVAPIAITLLQIYLLLHLQELRRAATVEPNANKQESLMDAIRKGFPALPNPWIGTTDGRLAGVVFAVTSVVLPLCVVPFALFWFLEPFWPFPIGAGVLAGLLGLATFRAARRKPR